jgi:hypothetical protein
MDKIMETLDSTGIDCVGCTERTLVESISPYSFVCLRCALLVSMHYRLYSVTVRMKVMQNGRLVRFSKRADYWCAFSRASVNKTTTLLGVYRAAVSVVMTAYTNSLKTSSATRTSGRKPKLIERDRRTLKRIMSKNDRTAAAKVTAELSIHLADPVLRELHKSNIHGITAIDTPLITENNVKRRKGRCDDHKTLTSDDRKYGIWLDESSCTLFQRQTGCMFGERPRKLTFLNV